MPVSKLALIQSSILFVLVGLGALLVIVGMSLWLVGRAEVNAEAVSTMREFRGAIVNLRTTLQDAESGQRGFLLTNDAAYLKPYETAQDKVGAAIARLRSALTDDPAAAMSVDALVDVIRRKFAELQRTLDLVQAGKRNEAMALVRTNEGEALTVQARKLLDGLTDVADARLTSAAEDQRTGVSYLRWVSILGAVLIVLVAAGCGWLVYSYTRQLVAAQREVEAANASLEARVMERTAELGRANEEIQRFAYIVTHDLRAPLVNIMGFTSEMETGLASLQAVFQGPPPQDADPAVVEAHRAATEDLPEAIGFIRSSTRKMDGLINAILKLSREGRRVLRPETVDLDALARAAAASIRHQVTEAEGDVHFDLKAPAIISDRLSLEQIIGNLLDNAVKYRSKDRPPVIAIRTRVDGLRRVVIEIEDNGRGIAKQDHDRIFELFRRSGTQDQPGEGIGLAHVRTMARSLGGEISVASEIGKGTTFTISLPRDLRAILERSVV